MVDPTTLHPGKFDSSPDLLHMGGSVWTCLDEGPMGVSRGC